jgi:hypothetical protein
MQVGQQIDRQTDGETAAIDRQTCTHAHTMLIQTGCPADVYGVDEGMGSNH